MSSQKEKLTKLQRTVEDLMRERGSEFGDPAEFLASLVAGVDPRPINSTLYDYVKQVDEQIGEDDSLPRNDWCIIRHLILNSGLYKCRPVDLKDSIIAATKLIDFLHPKQKAVDVQSTNTHIHHLAPPLTQEEIELFHKYFEENF